MKVKFVLIILIEIILNFFICINEEIEDYKLLVE
jgi:hypothetical protein